MISKRFPECRIHEELRGELKGYFVNNSQDFDPIFMNESHLLFLAARLYSIMKTLSCGVWAMGTAWKGLQDEKGKR